MLKRRFVVGLVAVGSVIAVAVASGLTSAATVRRNAMVPFPSNTVGVVAANLSRRQIQSSHTVRVVVIDERGQLIRIEGSLKIGQRSYPLSAGGGATPPGAATFRLKVPRADLKLLSGCGPITLSVAGYEAKRTPIASDTTPLVPDQPRCAKVPTDPSPLNPAIGQAGVVAPLSMEVEDHAQQMADLRSAVNVGAKWIRLAIEWKFIQQGGHSSFNWVSSDNAIKEASSLHLYTLAQIETAPSWARPSGASYPRNPVQFATFAAEAAARYAPYGVRAWEIWNEPNFAGFWSPYVDPAAYARLLRITAVAIHAVEPSSNVISGGLARVDCDGTSYTPNVFLSQVLADGGVGQTNAIGDDPYTYPVYPYTSQPVSLCKAGKNSYEEITESGEGLLALLRKYGDGDKRIWVTEFGAPDHGTTPTAGPGVGLTGQADELAAIFCAVRSGGWGGPVFWYDLRNDGSGGNDASNFFGLLYHNGSPKPAAAVFTQAARDRLNCSG